MSTTALKKLLLLIAGVVLLGGSALAAPPSTISGSMAICDPNNPSNCAKPDSSGNLPVTGGGGGGSTVGYTPSAYASPLAVSTTSARVALPAGATVIVYNKGASTAFCSLGNSAVVATTDNEFIPPTGYMVFVPGAATHVACITSTATTTMNVSGGAGTPVIGTGIASVLSAVVKASSTAAVAGDAAMVVTESPNSAAIRGVGATGAAPPANANYMGANCGNVVCGLTQANASGFLNMTTATTTEIVPLTGGQAIYVTGWDVLTNGTTNVKFVRGTGTNCGTGTADVTANYPLVASLPYGRGAGLGVVFVVTAGNALCVVNSAAVTTAISVSYSKAP